MGGSCDSVRFRLLHCTFTDGSARNETRTQKCAGWDFTAITKRARCGLWSSANQKRRRVLHRCHKGHEQHCGDAGRVIEALFWLNTCVERGTLNAYDNVLITVDSLCVKGLIEEKFTARENRVLAKLPGHTWKVT